MKPSVEDQLQGTCRVLETVVAPQVGEPYARSILAGLIANLRMLTAAIPAVPGFLRHDNAATMALLTDLEAALPDELSEGLAGLRDAAEPDPSDIAALDERNHALRALLARAAQSDALTPEQQRALVAHMSDRASQMPMRYVPTAPSPPAKEKT